MGAEFLVWRYRPALLVFTVLFFVVCKVHLASADNKFAYIGKLYPRGSHWAVGHLMGKKSTDNLLGPVESESINYQPLPVEGRRPGGFLQPSRLASGLIGALAGLERQNEAAPHREMVLDRKRKWEVRERNRTMTEVSAQRKRPDHGRGDELPVIGLEHDGK